MELDPARNSCGASRKLSVNPSPVPAGLGSNRAIIALGIEGEWPDVDDDVTDAPVRITDRRIPIGDHTIQAGKVAASEDVENSVLSSARLNTPHRSIFSPIQLRNEAAVQHIPVARAQR